jgi:hypothetical protein
LVILVYTVFIGQGKKPERMDRMTVVLVHDHYDAEHLESVKNEMLTMGAPVIKAVWMDCYGHYAALEGCHRIRAAATLGLNPVIEEIEYNDDIVDGMDGEWTVAQIADASNTGPMFIFD